MTFIEEIRWIRKNGVEAWLTWCNVDEACGAPLRRSVRFWRWVLG